MDVKEEDILGDLVNNHWYYISKERALRQFIAPITSHTVLDVGAGSGYFSKQLLEHDITQRAICVDPNYPSELSERHLNKPIEFVKQVSQEEKCGLILMMDVLEHVEDDVALLKQYMRYLSDDGYIAITVPAFQCLWSGHDVFLEHYRRYTSSMLERAVQQAGLEIVKTHYFYATLFPTIAITRWLKNKWLQSSSKVKAKSELSIAPTWLNRLFIAMHAFEQKVIFPRNQLAGLSVFCLCKKPHDIA